MNTLLLVGIVGVAAAALGMGSLSNTISLTVQDLGVGETTLETPLSQAAIDFNIARASAAVGDTTETHNVIDECEIHVGEGQIDADSKVYCKLTGENGDVVAEGSKILTHTAPTSTIFTVAIDPSDFPNNKVQNIHDVILVVLGPEQIVVPP